MAQNKLQASSQPRAARRAQGRAGARSERADMKLGSILHVTTYADMDMDLFASVVAYECSESIRCVVLYDPKGVCPTGLVLLVIPLVDSFKVLNGS